jgi:hypothetical protein
VEDNWQPISTAPDGEDILGTDGGTVDRTWEGWMDGDGNPVYVHADWVSWEPTHWMPLPKPPRQPMNGEEE